MQRPFFHFPQIGYRRNPFGALTDEEWTAVSVLPPAVERALVEGFDHLQILGPMGIGKSSTLLALQRWFVEQEESSRQGAKAQRKKSAKFVQSADKKVVYEYLPEGQRHFVTNTSGLDIFLLDEGQRLNWWQRRKLVKAAFHLQIIFSSHEDLAPLFNKKELSVTSVDLTGEIDEGWITAVLHKRLAYFAIPDQPHATLTPDAISFLVETFGQNLRQMEYFLYEVWQQLETTESVDVSFLRNMRSK
jgi:DNA polymerase III delta prime subunit